MCSQVLNAIGHKLQLKRRLIVQGGSGQRWGRHPVTEVQPYEYAWWSSQGVKDGNDGVFIWEIEGVQVEVSCLWRIPHVGSEGVHAEAGLQGHMSSLSDKELTKHVSEPPHIHLTIY